MSALEFILAIYIAGVVISAVVILAVIDDAWPDIEQDVREQIPGADPSTFHWIVVFLLLTLCWPFVLLSELFKEKD